MEQKIKSIEAEVNSFSISSKETLENFRLKFISKKGLIPSLFDDLKQAPAEEKKKVGKLLNDLKQLAEGKFKTLQEGIENLSIDSVTEIDLSLPVAQYKLGNQHPLSLTRYRIIEVFEKLGFNLADGPEIEDDWHNFTALNFPPNHPAREMQDTFFIEKNPDILLRTHTSNVQIRLMKQQKTPIRSIMPGRVYRNEAISARAHCFFHQVEGLYIDKNVGFADLKQTLYHFAQEMYGKDIEIRYRPSFFPFTEPSAEIDISCLICKGKGCNICKHSGWVEIAGSGMVHPNVLKNCDIDPEEYTGFAFGMGIERVTQLLFQVNDLRLYSENDIRFFKTVQASDVMRAIKKVGVVGAGSMGQGIAQACATSGYEVLLCDVNPEIIEKGILNITRNFDQAISKGKSSVEKKEATLSRISAASPQELKGDLIIEAAIEKLEIKQKIFSGLEEINDTDTILATNTSSLSVSKIASALKHPQRFVGLHFFNPAHLMKLVEVIAGEQTDTSIIPSMATFVKSIDKIAVIVKDSPGFIVNRVARHYYLESLKMLEENVADIGTIDALTKSAGFKLGPFELMDLIGNDINLEVSKQMYEAFGQVKRFRPSPIQEGKVKSGQLGKKTGKGYYDYEKK